jgi:integrase
VRVRTLDYYKRVLRPPRASLGGLSLRALSPMHVQALLGRMGEAKASARAQQMTYTVLRTALRDAVRMRLLAVNPLDAVSRPRAPRPEIQALDAGQVRALLAAAAGDPFEAFYALAVGTGLRFGELAGLRWGDLDLEAGAVHVRRGLVERESGARSLDETKTSRARRKVDMPAFAIAALRRHRAAVGALPHPSALVFTSSEGTLLRRSNLHRRSYKPLLARAKLPAVSFHALRHTAATLALAAGVNPKVVQERLGHSSVTLTLDTYSHAVPTLGQDAAARLDALLGG